MPTLSSGFTGDEAVLDLALLLRRDWSCLAADGLLVYAPPARRPSSRAW